MENRDSGTQHKLRMPPELKERVSDYAKAHNRSLNAEIIAMMEEAIAQREAMDERIKAMTGAEAMDILRGIQQMIAERK